MDIYRVCEDLKFVNQIGKTLNLQERMKLELALMKLTETTDFDQILFWGKIEGIKKDYYIAQGLNFKGCYEFPRKTFYWCSGSDFNFAKFTEVKEEYCNDVDQFRGMFIGQPDKILIEAKQEAVQEDQADQNEGDEEKVEDVLVSESSVEVKPPPQNFLELDRLVYTVRAIEVDCQTVPIGAYKMTPSHEMRYDDEFKGLSIKNSNCLSFYQHFRNPQSTAKKDMMMTEDVFFKYDFLDPVGADLPKGCWSLQSDPSKTKVTLRSLLWPGYVSYHRSNSKVFGGLYIGDGRKNVDLPFLL